MVGELHLTNEIVQEFIKAGTLALFQMLVIAGLCGFLKYLLLELKDARKEYTASTNNFIETLSAMKEIMRDVLHKKGS